MFSNLEFQGGLLSEKNLDFFGLNLRLVEWLMVSNCPATIPFMVTPFLSVYYNVKCKAKSIIQASSKPSCLKTTNPLSL